MKFSLHQLLEIEISFESVSQPLILDLKLSPQLQSVKLNNLDEYRLLKVDLQLASSFSLQILSLTRSLLVNPSLTAEKALCLRELTILDSIHRVVSDDHLTFISLERLEINRLEPRQFLFRPTLLFLKFESHYKDLSLQDYPLLREIEVGTAFHLQFRRLPSLQTIKADKCEFVFKEGGLQEEPFVL